MFGKMLNNFAGLIMDRMEKKIERIVKEIKRYLKDKYGDNIRKVILYGSHARGEATEDSDVDVMIVVSDDVDNLEILNYLTPLLSKFMDYGELVIPLIIDEKTWAEYPLDFLYNVRKEGIELTYSPH